MKGPNFHWLLGLTQRGQSRQTMFSNFFLWRIKVFAKGRPWPNPPPILNQNVILHFRIISWVVLQSVGWFSLVRSCLHQNCRVAGAALCAGPADLFWYNIYCRTPRQILLSNCTSGKDIYCKWQYFTWFTVFYCNLLYFFNEIFTLFTAVYQMKWDDVIFSLQNS